MVVNESKALRWVAIGSGKGWMEKMRFQVSAECCESFARTDVSSSSSSRVYLP